ncbi:peptidase, M16 family [Campylobacter iguaniorum]|uniref:Peptidase, M16 family n=1 Tax=Campylobacter iguaniorum TaxID=1244531 RepID=A0A076F8K8_9BACT|nr:pitrilysin family protein [Campylobacter iguaniorum]AII14570.1 peptidase, M16 family [Campylobacter iguaniorum]
MERLDALIKGINVPVIYEKSSNLPIVYLKLVFKVAGVGQESVAGLAKLSTALLNEGTKKLGVNEFSSKLEIRAIDINAECGFETFSIEINCLKEHFDFAQNMLKDLLKDPNLTKSTLDKLKTQALGIIAANKTDFDYQAKIALNKILFDGSNLAYASIGTKQSLENISLSDVKKFLKENLDISNLFIVLGGDVEPSEVKFSAILDSLEVGKPRELEPVKTSDICKKEFIKEQTEQAYIYFGAPFNVKKDERYLANVSAFILGSSGFGSRLMEEIRVKRGLAYSVYAKNNISLSHSSFEGYMQTKNESKDEAIELIISEFDKFIKDGVTQKELDAAKNFLLGSEPLSKETLFKRLAIAQNEYYSGFELGEFDANLKKIKELKLDDLNKFIKAHTEILKQSFAVIYNEI